MENQQQQNTPLCRANCGFYGSPATEDMCSKCFKDMIKRKQETTGAAASSGTTASTSNPGTLPCSASTPTTADAANNSNNASPSPVPVQPQQDETQEKKKPNRCGVCNKRVGLTGFECRCGGLFCGEHRYDSAHNCTFDYKTAGREELRAKHPQVVTDKIERI